MTVPSPSWEKILRPLDFGSFANLGIEESVKRCFLAISVLNSKANLWTGWGSNHVCFPQLLDVRLEAAINQRLYMLFNARVFWISYRDVGFRI